MSLTSHEVARAGRSVQDFDPGLIASIGCLTVAVAGTNGKGTTARMIQRVLEVNHRQAIVAEGNLHHFQTVLAHSRELDFLILKLDAVQIEALESFRPSVAVLMNAAPDRFDFYDSEDRYLRAMAGLFRTQQAFDWAVVQQEALIRIRELGLPIPAKTITFSSIDPSADLSLDRGLLLSRIPNWSGPLLNMDHCQVRGPHNAENLMAALATGHVLRLSLEGMVDPLKTFNPGRHHFELVAEINGVQFIDDSKARNPDALKKTLLSARPGRNGEANVLLIAGGDENGLDYHHLGPIISQRVKRVFLIGSATEKLRAAWSLFTPCTVTPSLVEAIAQAAKSAASGDVVLLSPACSKFEEFPDCESGGELFCHTVKSISSGALSRTHHIDGNLAEMAIADQARKEI